METIDFDRFYIYFNPKDILNLERFTFSDEVSDGVVKEVFPSSPLKLLDVSEKTKESPEYKAFWNTIVEWCIDQEFITSYIPYFREIHEYSNQAVLGEVMLCAKNPKDRDEPTTGFIMYSSKELAEADLFEGLGPVYTRNQPGYLATKKLKLKFPTINLTAFNTGNKMHELYLQEKTDFDGTACIDLFHGAGKVGWILKSSLYKLGINSSP